MIKICDKSLLKPLILLFENSTKSSCYPDIWKRSNTIPAHKKNDQQLVNNHRPISLLPIFGKIFEKIIFNNIYSFLLDEKLLNPNQSGFRRSDSCINQLLTITNEIFEAFDCIHLSKLGQFSYTYQKHLTRFDMKAYFISLRVSASQEIF